MKVNVLTLIIVVICIFISILFSDTKVIYENGTTENMLFVEVIKLIIDENKIPEQN